MQGIILRTAINALGLAVAALILPGISISGLGTLLVAALLMGLVNALLRPLVILVTLPITIISFGMFLLVINAAMFGLVAAMLDGFAVNGFFAALFGWLIVSIVGALSSWTIGPDGRYEILVIEKQRW
jgi:putative membrane protein